MRIECIQQLAESGSKRVFIDMLSFNSDPIRKGAEHPQILLPWMGIEDTQHFQRQALNFQNSPSKLHPQNFWFHHLCPQDPHYFVLTMSMIAYATPILHMLVPVSLCKYQLGGHNRCVRKVCRCNPGIQFGKPSFYMNRHVEKNTDNIDQTQWTNLRFSTSKRGDCWQGMLPNNVHPILPTLSRWRGSG